MRTAQKSRLYNAIVGYSSDANIKDGRANRVKRAHLQIIKPEIFNCNRLYLHLLLAHNSLVIQLHACYKSRVKAYFDQLSRKGSLINVCHSSVRNSVDTLLKAITTSENNAKLRIKIASRGYQVLFVEFATVLNSKFQLTQRLNGIK